jgi:hypothetical protein
VLLGLRKIFFRHLAAFLLEAVKNIDHVFDPRQVNNTIPSSLILVAQLKDARTNRSQRSIVPWTLALLELPQLKSEILRDRIREGLENLPGVAFPNNRSEFGFFVLAAHESNIQLNVYFV